MTTATGLLDEFSISGSPKEAAQRFSHIRPGCSHRFLRHPDKASNATFHSGPPSHYGKGLGVRLHGSFAMHAVILRHLDEASNASGGTTANSFAFLCHPDDGSASD